MISVMKYIVIIFSFIISFTFASVFAANVTLRERDKIDFATIIVDPAGDLIVITPSGNISASNMSFFSGSPSAARFSAQGDKNTVASISFSSGDTLTGSGAAIPLGNFTHDAGTTPAFSSNKKLEFNVGASLTVNPSQAEGAYTGVYTVTVDYQ